MSSSPILTTKAPAPLTPAGLYGLSKAKRSMVVSNQPLPDGASNVQAQLDSAGLLNYLYLSVFGTITVAGTVSSGTFQGYPTPVPYTLLKRIRFGNGSGVSLRDLSGWSQYKHSRYRNGFDPAVITEASTSFDSNAATLMGQNGTRMVKGANVAAGTYAVNFLLPIPIAYNAAGEGGLINLQGGTNFYFQMDIANIANGISATGGTNDVFNALVGTGLTITPNLNYSLCMEYFDMPIQNGSVPNLSQLLGFYLKVSEQNTNPLVAGNNAIRMQNADWYTMILAECINNSQPVGDAYLGTSSLQWAGAVSLETLDRWSEVNHSVYQHGGLKPMDGVIDFDFGLRREQLLRREQIDAINNSNITSLTANITTASNLTVSGTNGIYCVCETLQMTPQGA